MKRVLVLSDLHCGHFAGLTPPGWQQEQKPGDSPTLVRANKLASNQKALWNFYTDGLRKYGPFDVILVNGDCVEGKGRRSGGSELNNQIMIGQCEQAVYCIRQAITRQDTKIVMSYGTAYHTGEEEDWEDLVAKDIGGKIGSHEWVDVEGVIFDMKHHIGTSSIPHGRFTAIARDRLWSVLWNMRGQTPASDVIIRSHVHFFGYCGDHSFLAMTTPALQGWGSKYGARRCSGLVDFGFIVFDCDRGDLKFHAHIMEGSALATAAIKV